MAHKIVIVMYSAGRPPRINIMFNPHTWSKCFDIDLENGEWRYTDGKECSGPFAIGEVRQVPADNFHGPIFVGLCGNAVHDKKLLNLRSRFAPVKTPVV